GAFVPGRAATLLPLEVHDRVIRCAPLVCYEDIFPALARSSVLAGAEVLFVATNNAWYGEEGGASQHAAHSVLRAVENRRPVMRCGNGGWSGWIDAYGTVREVLRDDRGSIYFRGGGNITVMQERRWLRRQSFYTRHGNWFIGVSGGLVAAGLLVIRFGRRQ
ncbi:MAG: nitrilase-related carbon-nitrogen hydrolase, partial [Opitutales bacterium]